MSNKILGKYTEATKAVKEYKDKNVEVFDEYNSLLLASTEAEKDLKKEVRENVKSNIANDFIKVTYAPAFKKWYDAEVVDKKATVTVLRAIKDAGALTQQIDRVKFEELVEKGEVPVELKQEAFREEEMTPRVIISEVKQDK